jgi:methylated-DNA-protein-cysteine methyltransferase related protein
MLPIDNESFFEQVYQVAKLIPKGRITSYGAIAAYLGSKQSARMVGWAMHSAPADVPAYRVVNRSGLLTGKHHFPSPDAMEQRLAAEGIKVQENRIQNFENLFWDPSKELLL